MFNSSLFPCNKIIHSYPLCWDSAVPQVKQAKCTYALSFDLEFDHLTGHTYRRDRRISVKI